MTIPIASYNRVTFFMVWGGGYMYIILLPVITRTIFVPSYTSCLLLLSITKTNFYLLSCFILSIQRTSFVSDREARQVRRRQAAAARSVTVRPPTPPFSSPRRTALRRRPTTQTCAARSLRRANSSKGSRLCVYFAVV